MSRARTCVTVSEEGDKIETRKRCSASIWGVFPPKQNINSSIFLATPGINKLQVRIVFNKKKKKVESSVICIDHEKRVIVTRLTKQIILFIPDLKHSKCSYQGCHFWAISLRFKALESKSTPYTAEYLFLLAPDPVLLPPNHRHKQWGSLTCS